jgi:transposase-like protein
VKNMSSEQIQDPVQCPGCGADKIRKHGKHLGKQRYFCKTCGLAFTGAEYRSRPGQEVTALKQENQRLLKVVEAARRLNVALGAYLKRNSAKALSNLNAKRERFVRLLASNTNQAQDTHLAEPGTKFPPQPRLF